MMLSTKCCRATVVKKTNPRQILTTRCTSNGPRSMHIHTMVCMCDIYIYMYRVLANVYIYIYIINIYIYYIYICIHTHYSYISIYIYSKHRSSNYLHTSMYAIKCPSSFVSHGNHRPFMLYHRGLGKSSPQGSSHKA